MRILGIDPGSLITGYGVIEVARGRASYITSGCVRTQAAALPERLRLIFAGISEIIDCNAPDEMAIEQVFMHRNADSALKLGQARGAAICAAANLAVPIHEYSARQVKQAVVGTGAAAKDQVQHMVKVLLKLPGTPQADAADALAVALCHSHMRSTLAQLPGAVRARAGRAR